MRNYRLTGIIVHRINVGEADRLIIFFSRERGLVTVRAKGVRKIKGKLKGALELFRYSTIELARGRSIDVITGAQISKPFDSFRTNLTDTSVAFYLSEAIVGLMAEV